VYYAKQSFSGISLSIYASLNGGSLLQNITDNKKTISNLINGVHCNTVGVPKISQPPLLLLRSTIKPFGRLG
jgi:hypothetical protein